MSAEPFPLDPREAAFTILEAWSADELVRRLEGRFRIRRSESSLLRETYLDTADWRLERARLVLAHRSTGKAGRGGRPGELVLSSASVPPARSPLRVQVRSLAEFPWELPEGELRATVAERAAVRRLLPQAMVEAEVTTLEVLDDRDKTVVRLEVTAGRALAGPPPVPALAPRPLASAVRVKPLRGYGAERDAVVAFLGGDPALRAESASRFERTLRALERDPAAERLLWRVELDGAARTGDQLRKALARLLEIMRRNEAGIRADLDTEYLHDYRVAVRRTRSLLSQAKDVFDPKALGCFRGEFRWLGQSTSPVRDLDVFLLAAHGRAGGLAGLDPEGLAPLRKLLARRRRTAFARLDGVLGSERYVEALERWSSFLEAPGADDEERAELPIREFAAQRIRRQHRRVLKRGGRVGPESPAVELHDLRIECKKLRYLVDAFGGLFPLQAGARLVKRLKSLQSALGDFNDAEVQAELLQGFAEDLGRSGKRSAQAAPTELLVEFGRAIERLGLRHAELRPKIAKRMRTFAREQGPAAMDELLGEAGSR